MYSDLFVLSDIQIITLLHGSSAAETMAERCNKGKTASVTVDARAKTSDAEIAWIFVVAFLFRLHDEDNTENSHFNDFPASFYNRLFSMCVIS